MNIFDWRGAMLLANFFGKGPGAPRFNFGVYAEILIN
jgi:hypothetical protein